MKILLANWVYNWGSTGYILRDLKNEFEKIGHEVVIAAAEVYGVREEKVYSFGKPFEWNIMSRLSRFGWPRFKGSTFATKRLINIIKKENPDVVNLHLLHGARLNFYYLLKYLGQHNVKTVVTNHAELYYTGSCGYSYDCNNWIDCECKNCPDKKYATYAYVFANPHMHWKLMKNAFDYFKKDYLCFTAVSPWVQDRFYKSPIVHGYNCSVVINGIDTDTFCIRRDSNVIESKFGKNKPFYILHVTANFVPDVPEDVKGGYYLVELARKMPNVTFVVVCTANKEVNNLPDNIKIWGKSKNQEELSVLYSNAEMTLLVSRRETFSMVTAESLCCGTPVVGFKAGGPESIAIEDASIFVNQKDVDALSKAIVTMREKHINRDSLSKIARKKFSAESMANGYLSVYKEFLKQ